MSAVAPKIRVMLVDDHAVVRVGFRMLLSASPDIEVAAEADSGELAYQQYAEVRPDVVIMDLSMPGMGGIEAVRRLPDSAFAASPGAMPNFSFSPHTYWFRLRLAWDARAAGTYLLSQEYPLSDHLVLYRPGPDGRYVAIETGDQYRYAQREVPVRAFGFLLTAKPGVTETYYLSLRGDGALVLDLHLASVGSAQAASDTVHSHGSPQAYSICRNCQASAQPLANPASFRTSQPRQPLQRRRHAPTSTNSPAPARPASQPIHQRGSSVTGPTIANFGRACASKMPQ